MKREWKESLREAFAAPAPVRKKEFLEQMSQNGMSMLEFVCAQAAYIRKWIWGVSIAVFGVSLLGAMSAVPDFVWLISALTPFLAVTVAAECGRSVDYGMAELEMATRFSLKSVLFARLGILGVENLAILCLMFLLGTGSGLLRPVQTGVCILTPYLLTAFIGMSIVRRYRGSEGRYLCAGAAVGVGFSIFLFRDGLAQIFQRVDFMWWIVGITLLFMGTVRQYGKAIGKTEELV